MSKKKKSLYIPYDIQYPDTAWKPVILDGKESDYIVGNNGVIVSKNKKHVHPFILDGHVTSNGYKIYDLIDHKKHHWMLGQRIVAIAFIPIPEHLKKYTYKELEVNHIKGDETGKLDNSVQNLEWVTSSENKYHAYKTGLKKDGEDHPEAIYTSDQINAVCYLLEEDKLSRMQIAKSTGVDDSTVGMVLSGTQWKSISKDYDFSKRKKKHTLYDEKVIKHALELLEHKDENNLSYADIGRIVGMSRTSVWYLYNKYLKQ